MITAGIKQVKNNLSALLAQVKAGEEIVITHRGRPIARIISEESGNRSIRAPLAPLIQKGLMVLPNRPILKDDISTAKVPGKPVSRMVIEDRR